MSSGVRRATRQEIPELAATLARAFAHDPFYSFLAGDAPERSQRMQDGWSGILRFGSAGLVETYTTDDYAGVALWIPPGHGGPSFIDSLRMTPSIARLAGWRRLRQVTNAIGALEERHRHHAPQAPLLPVGARRGARSAGRGRRDRAHAARARAMHPRWRSRLPRDGDRSQRAPVRTTRVRRGRGADASQYGRPRLAHAAASAGLLRPRPIELRRA